jgi:esterase/lipase superfamily enzyme
MARDEERLPEERRVEAAPPPPPPEPLYVIQTVFYATDRNVTGHGIPCDSPSVGTCFDDPDKAFGRDRGNVSYGQCKVSIPKDHRLGELEKRSRWEILLLKLKPDPEKHVVLLETALYDSVRFFAELSDRIAASAARRAFVFVHGYNVSFEDAARRTAQIAYDLQFDGAPIFYSWPSRGRLTAYSVDETNAEWTVPHLKDFLKDLALHSKAEEIVLIGHSMGCKPLSGAFDLLAAESAGATGVFREIVLTAPDINAKVFKRDIAPQMVAAGSLVTLYASSSDRALKISKKYHGYARAGDAGSGLVVMPGVETIDATDVDSGFLGHSYYAEVRSVLADLYYLIKDGKRAAQRFSLQPVVTETGQYWEFRK